MSRDELSLFSYEILGLVGRSGAGAHDLLRWARRGRILAWAGESQYYVEPKRLARLGYLSARREPGKTRERTVYALTDKGLAALREYAATPATFTPLKSDPLLRLLLADLVGERVTRDGLLGLRGELAELHERLDESEVTAATPRLSVRGRDDGVCRRRVDVQARRPAEEPGRREQARGRRRSPRACARCRLRRPVDRCGR